MQAGAAGKPRPTKIPKYTKAVLTKEDTHTPPAALSAPPSPPVHTPFSSSSRSAASGLASCVDVDTAELYNRFVYHVQRTDIFTRLHLVSCLSKNPILSSLLEPIPMVCAGCTPSRSCLDHCVDCTSSTTCPSHEAASVRREVLGEVYDYNDTWPVRSSFQTSSIATTLPPLPPVIAYVDPTL